MKKIFFIDYEKSLERVSKAINFSENIKINELPISNKEKNLFILNHTSILDNFIISKVVTKNNISWNSIRTVSSISEKKNIQNITLDIHGMFLVSGNLQKDSNTFENLWKKWKNSKDIIQIILFPEGTIFNNITKDTILTKSQKFIMNKIVKKPKFNNLLFPNIGAFNLIINRLSNELDYIYDFSITYRDKNKNRVINEENILLNLAENNLFINVKIEKYSLKDVIKDPYWLFKLWAKKDIWYDSN